MVASMLRSDFIPAADGTSDRLLIALHGLGDSAAGYRWLPDLMSLPWLNYLLVDAPDPYYTGFSWYDFGGDPAPGVERSRKEIFALLDQMRAKNFSTAKTTLFGFSQGCLMTLDVGLRYPSLFAGLVGVSGYFHEPEQLLRELSPIASRQRILFTHGKQDPLVPCAEVRLQAEQVRKAGIQIEWREFNKVHTIAGEEEMKVIRDFVARGYAGG